MLCLFSLTAGAFAADTSPLPAIRPLYSFNQSPLVQIYGLPALGESRILAPDQENLALRLQIANNFAGDKNAFESVFLDGETHRVTLAWSQGLTDGMEWGFELPYLTHSGGFLDSTIERFHETLGLSQGGRTDVSRNQIDYRYTRDGVDLVHLTRPVSGWSDARLLAAKQLASEAESGGADLALRASLKLPTGDSGELRGSGSTDLALWLSAAPASRPEAWALYGGGGVLLMSTGKVLPQLQRHEVGFGTVGLSRDVTSRLALNAQLDAHTPFYEHSHLRPLGTFAVQGLLGLNWEVTPRRFLQFSASEDLVPNTSPDITFNLSLTLPY